MMSEISGPAVEPASIQLTRLAERPFRHFLGWSAAAGLISGLGYWLFAVFVTRTWNPPPNQDVAAPVAIVLGTAVAFSGAIVAIALATVALNLQRAQDLREDQQSKLDMLKLLSDETSRFLEPYARLLHAFRNLTAIVEIHHVQLWRNVDGSRLLDPAYAQDPQISESLKALAPLITRMSKALTEIKDDLGTLYLASRSNVFAGAVFDATLAHGRWQMSAAVLENGQVSLESLPTVCAWLETKSHYLDELTVGSDKDLLDAWSVARMMATSARDAQGAEFNDMQVRGLLLLGFLVEPINVQYLKEGKELRAPLVELICEISTAYVGSRVRAALCEVFSNNPALAASAERLVQLTPSPIDQEMQTQLTRYAKLRPRVAFSGKGFA